MKTALLVLTAIVFLVILLVLAYSTVDRFEPKPMELPDIQPELIFNEDIKVEEFQPEGFPVLPCFMEYGDNMTTCHGETKNVSLMVGKANTANEAVYKVKDNLGRLKAIYSRQTTGVCFSSWGGDWLGWTSRIFVKHRGEKEKYKRSGWYITALDKDGGVQGDFFLSDDGILMPAQQTCTREGCCA